MSVPNPPLQWQPLAPYRTLIDLDQLIPPKQRAGLYIWGFVNDDNHFQPYYAGKHRNVIFRLCEHLCNLKGGNYNVYKPEHLFSDKDIRYYNPVSIVHKVQFIAGEYDAEQTLHVNNMIERFHFTYCLLPDFNVSGSKAESTVLHCFSRWLLINTRFGTPCADVDVGNLFKVVDGSWDNREFGYDKRKKFRK